MEGGDERPLLAPGLGRWDGAILPVRRRQCFFENVEISAHFLRTDLVEREMHFNCGAIIAIHTKTIPTRGSSEIVA